jgi:TusA-related sulfurtransferase
MRKMLFVGAALLGAALWLSGPALAGGKCGCPCGVKGAEKAVTNTDNGVTITITSKDPAVVKKIQDAAAKMKEGGCEKCTHKPGCKCKKCAAKQQGGKPEEKKAEKKEDKK